MKIGELHLANLVRSFHLQFSLFFLLQASYWLEALKMCLRSHSFRFWYEKCSKIAFCFSQSGDRFPVRKNAWRRKEYVCTYSKCLNEMKQYHSHFLFSNHTNRRTMQTCGVILWNTVISSESVCIFFAKRILAFYLNYTYKLSLLKYVCEKW